MVAVTLFPESGSPEFMLQAALYYAGRDTPIFPLHGLTPDGRCDCGNPDCKNVAKHPWTINGFKDATTDELMIRRWWKQYPLANIGLPTGLRTGIMVLDVDPRDGGDQSLLNFISEYGPLPSGPVTQTGSGGNHFIFRCPNPPPKNSASALAPGLDIRSEGGYIVAPPSLHESGERYIWVDRPEEVPPSAPPPWLLEKLATKRLASSTQEIIDRIDVAAVLSGVTEGQRDIALFRTASKFRYAGIPIELAQELILRAAEGCSPPFPADEALAKVASAYGRYEATLKDLPEGQTDLVQTLKGDMIRVLTVCEMGPVEFIFADLEKGSRELDSEMSMRLLMPGTAPEPYKQRINLLSISARESCRRELESIYGKDVKWAKVLATAFAKCANAFLLVDRAIAAPRIAPMEKIDYLIESIAPAQGTTILFGAGSAAKTFLLLKQAICISKGIPWMGRPTEKRNVLFVDYETGEEVFGFRLGRLLMGMGYQKDESEGIFYWDAQGIPIADQIEALRQATERHQCGAIMVDHAGLACGLEPERSESALRVKRALSRIGLPCIMIAHITGDGEKDPNQVLRPFGSVYWSSLARKTWFVNRIQDQESDLAELGLYCRKNNDGRKPQDFGINVYFNQETGPIAMEPADIRNAPKLNAVRGPEYRVWDALEIPMTLKELMAAVGLSESRLRTILTGNPRMFMGSGIGAGRGNETIWTRA